MRRQLVLAVLSLFVAVSFRSVRARADDNAQLIREAEQTLATFKSTDPGMAALLHKAAGYAVFPTVGKGGAGIGGAHGSGVLFDAAGTPRGKATLTQVTVGLQLGGQTYSEVILFETPKAMADFQAGNFALAAQASAVALKSGAAAHANYEHGVMVLTATKAGLMFETSVGGQKFKFEPFALKAK
jgi:lipid-binding SYLF domain-containing protein